jgi:hypothetical protein
LRHQWNLHSTGSNRFIYLDLQTLLRGAKRQLHQ